MKKGFFIIGLLLTIFSFQPTTTLQAQTGSSKWDGPRWASMQVTNTVNEWIEENVPPLVNDGDWWGVDYTYEGRGTWTAVISWGIDGFSTTPTVIGSVTLLIKSNGSYTVVEEVTQE